jgi:hypothetical protein
MRGEFSRSELQRTNRRVESGPRREEKTTVSKLPPELKPLKQSEFNTSPLSDTADSYPSPYQGGDSPLQNPSDNDEFSTKVVDANNYKPAGRKVIPNNWSSFPSQS